MQAYAVIETDDGLTVVEVGEDSTAEQAAERNAGVLADETTYKTYEDAYDAMLVLDAESEIGNESDF